MVEIFSRLDSAKAYPSSSTLEGSAISLADLPLVSFALCRNRLLDPERRQHLKGENENLGEGKAGSGICTAKAPLNSIAQKRVLQKDRDPAVSCPTSVKGTNDNTGSAPTRVQLRKLRPISKGDRGP